MPLPLVALGWSAFLASTIGTLAFRLFSALGIGIATYTGVSILITNGENFIKARFAEVNSTIPAVFDTLTYIGVDQGLSMIFSAAVAASAIQSLRWVKK